jgi:beta-lactam-binding protein with PASTA domain
MRIPRFRRGAPPPAVDARAETIVQGGTVVEEEVPPGPPPPRQGPPPTLWPWLLLLLLLVVGGLLAVWLTHRGSNHDQASPAVTVPDVVHKKQSQAVGRLKEAGLVPSIVTKPSGFRAGLVFAQVPTAGTRVTKGSSVTISVSAQRIVVVPAVVQMKAATAKKALRSRGLTAQTTSVTSSRKPGVVLAQSPSPGTHVARGSVVALRVSQGRVRVPNVVGESRASAAAALQKAGLAAKTANVASPKRKGTVVAQSPAAGSSVAKGSGVLLNVSSGPSTGGAPPPPPPPPPPGPPPPPAPPPPPPPPPATATVPDVTGLSQAAAQRKLSAAGFKPGVVYVSSNEPLESVVAQSPQGGTTARRGSHVQLNASLGPNPGALQSVPNVLGLTAKQAVARLRSAGFKVQELQRTVSNRSQNGLVVDEQPSGGRKVPVGTTVTVYVGRAG